MFRSPPLFGSPSANCATLALAGVVLTGVVLGCAKPASVDDVELSPRQLLAFAPGALEPARASHLASWLETGEATAAEVLQRFEGLPLGAVIYTDIGRDGMLCGPNTEATARLARSTSLPVIASGGVGSAADLRALARTRVIAGAIVGKAIYEGRVNVAEAVAVLAGGAP